MRYLLQCAIYFLRPPVHIWWAHMRRFLSVHHWIIMLDNNIIHISESVGGRNLKFSIGSYFLSWLIRHAKDQPAMAWLHSKKKSMWANEWNITALTSRTHCQRQVAFVKIIVELQSFGCNMSYLLTKISVMRCLLLENHYLLWNFGTPLGL